MYGIIAFFRRNYFAVLFVALEFFSLYFVFRDNYYHQAGFFNSANSVAGSVYKTYSGITGYFNLKSENERLSEENTRLQNALSALPDTSKHVKVPKTNPYGDQYNFISAEIIDNSTNMISNYITLNVGKREGITEGMGIVSSAGVAGIVLSVSDHYSVAMSMLHKNFQLSAMLKKGGAFGTVVWKGEDYRYAWLMQIPMSEKVTPGDTIITSGYSTIFPKAITIGVVEEVTPLPTEYFYKIKMRLTTNFKKLRFVYVISDLTKKEKTDLEEATYKANNEGK